jgi:predicted aspartyl protease
MPIVDCGFVDIPEVSASTQLQLYGPSIPVDIGFDPSYDHKSGKVPEAAIRQVPALVDTGSTESCIDDALAQELNLPLVDRAHVAGVGGAHEVSVYLAQVHVPRLNFTVYGRFAGVHLRVGGQLHRAILGRTFLRSMILIYDGRDGSVRITR